MGLPWVVYTAMQLLPHWKIARNEQEVSYLGCFNKAMRSDTCSQRASLERWWTPRT